MINEGPGHLRGPFAIGGKSVQVGARCRRLPEVKKSGNTMVERIKDWMETMTKPNLPLAGSCRCGKVHVEITIAPIMTSACHCRGCQKMSASAFSLTAMVPAAGFSVTKGNTRRGGLGEGQLDHEFCPDCMTWMFTRIEGVDDFLNVRAALFDDTAWFTPFIETMTQEKLAWVSLPARHSFEGFPPVEEYQALMAEYGQ